MSGLGKLFGSSKPAVPIVQPVEVPVAPAPPLGAKPFAHAVNSRDQATARYGEIADGVWPKEDKWMTYVPVPAELSAHWFVDGNPHTPITRIHCNVDMAQALAAAMQNILNRGCAHELKSYDGCLNIRNVRGSSYLSAHAYGLALDINCDTNQLGGKSSWSAEFVKCWTDAGFDWGGNFSGRKDPMHFSLAWEN